MFLALLALGSTALNSGSQSLWMVSTREEAVEGSAALRCSNGGGWAVGAIMVNPIEALQILKAAYMDGLQEGELEGAENTPPWK